MSALEDYISLNDERVDGLVEKFSAYSPRTVDQVLLKKWLQQFEEQDYDLALRVLENIDYYSQVKIQQSLRVLYAMIKDTLDSNGFSDHNKIVFLPMGSAGKSGNIVLNLFKKVNKLTDRRFAYPTQIPEIRHDIKDPIFVFLDDFIGTGNQVCDFWDDILQEYLTESDNIFYGCIVAFKEGVNLIEKRTPLSVINCHQLNEEFLIGSSTKFSNREKIVLKKYCQKADGIRPLGFGDLGAMISFSHESPDQVLMIQRGSKKQRKWKGILPRYDDLP